MSYHLKCPKTLASLSGCLFWLFNQTRALAFTISPDVTVDSFNQYTGNNVAGMLLGVTFWILRIFGAILVMWGIYGYITSKKDGEASQISTALVKIVFGAVFIGMPMILRNLEIIN